MPQRKERVLCANQKTRAKNSQAWTSVSPVVALICDDCLLKVLGSRGTGSVVELLPGIFNVLNVISSTI